MAFDLPHALLFCTRLAVSFIHDGAVSVPV
jgi:hypothetical protein